MKKHRFALGLCVYALLLLALVFADLFVFWQYIAAYEFSRVEGVMDGYMADRLTGDLDREIERYSLKHESEFESAGDVAAALRAHIGGGELSSRSLPQASSESQRVYSVRLDGQELGRVYFLPYSGGPLAFGFEYWFPSRAEFEFDGFSQKWSVLAPEQADVAVNGVLLTAENCAVSWAAPEALEPYADALEQTPSNALYSFTSFSDPDVGLLSGSGEYLIAADGDGRNSFTVTQVCPAELSEELEGYAGSFVRAYVNYASGYAGSRNLLALTVQGSALYRRILSTTDRLSWVRGVSSTMSELSVGELEYYGCAATLEAHYTLTSRGTDTDNNMKLILTQTGSGWRVAEIELY